MIYDALKIPHSDAEHAELRREMSHPGAAPEWLKKLLVNYAR